MALIWDWGICVWLSDSTNSYSSRIDIGELYKISFLFSNIKKCVLMYYVTIWKQWPASQSNGESFFCHFYYWFNDIVKNVLSCLVPDTMSSSWQGSKGSKVFLRACFINPLHLSDQIHRTTSHVQDPTTPDTQQWVDTAFRRFFFKY